MEALSIIDAQLEIRKGVKQLSKTIYSNLTRPLPKEERYHTIYFHQLDLKTTYMP